MNPVRPAPLLLIAGRHTGIALFTVFAIFPFVWAGSVALSADTSAMWLFPQALIPHDLSLAWVVRVFHEIPLLIYLRNSLWIATLTTAGVLLLAIPCGFALAQIDFPGRRTLFALIILTMMLPTETMIIPNFLTCIHLGLLDTWTGTIVPNIASALGAFMMRQAFAELPKETLDAARVDGASEWQLLWRIALPLAMPMAGALATLTFVAAWNDYLWPQVILNSQDKVPLAVGIFHDLTGHFSTSTSLLMAAITVSVIPVLAGFAATQRYFLSSTLVPGHQAR
ncbi:ABC-type glycerol-3-phosphate transport system permease component [Silvimonas terrae]|uniref:ABC-type glycerol-3-phosphate transport system permease component n=1 Tax=Silvimonas terrae TaxID=300266 RepID=A0A840RMG1_9NEIS|nr:carbohydrate ABC transporter permease [Silvimonas terrae]MBB5193466.1 ABC-type glycerol-3-phosphate transport system permease component [Silvimonas terrae]